MGPVISENDTMTEMLCVCLGTSTSPINIPWPPPCNYAKVVGPTDQDWQNFALFLLFLAMLIIYYEED